MIKFEKNGKTYSRGEIKRLYRHVSLPNDTKKWMSFLEKEGFSVAPEPVKPVKPVNDAKTTDIASAKGKLNEIDLLSVRPLRTGNTERLETLENKAKLIRDAMIAKYGEDWYK